MAVAAKKKESVSPSTASVLDRKAFGGWSVEQAVYAVVGATAVLLYLFQLGARPYHHDESIHAFFSWKITQAGVGDYRYDPVYHGPVLYYATALTLWLFGDSDFTGRLAPVLFGFGVLAFAWPLRGYLGRWGAICFLVLLTLSPTWTYFARFQRHDIYLALCVLAAIHAAFRYGDTRRPLHLYVGGFSLGLAACTKEDMYLLGPWFIISLAGMLLWGVWRRERSPRQALSATLDFLRSSLVPLLTALIVFAIVWLVLYTSFGTHPENWDAVSRAIEYWWNQHKTKRIGNAWWYYLPQLAIYEPLIFFPALAMVLALLAQRRAPSPFLRFTALWGVGSLLIYAWAQEKVPWLLVPQLLPLALLAACFFARLIENDTLRRPLPLALTSVFAAFTLWSLVNANYVWDAPRPEEPGAALNPPVRHAEMLSYVQSTYDIHTKVMHHVEEAGRLLGTGTGTRLAVGGDATWPLSWYLRHYPVNWAGASRNVDAPIVVVDRKADLTKAIDEAVGDTYEKIPFQIRGWWTWETRFPTARELLRFLLFREAWKVSDQIADPTGSSDAVLYVYKDLKPGVQIAAKQVNPPPGPRAYAQQPESLSAAVVWGSQGSGRGEFSEPRGLAADATGHVYVVDSKNNRIQKLAPSGEVVAVWGAEGHDHGQFKDPCGVAVATDGSVYVADTWNHRIQKFTASGQFVTERHEESPSLWGPRGVAVGPDGSVYVTDTGNKRVLKYTSSLELVTSWGGEGSKPGQFIEPVGIAVNAAGEIIVADTGNRRLQFFQSDGSYVREWSVSGWEEFYTEPYIAADGGDVYVTDSYNHRFARYSEGRLARVWGKSGSGSGEFNRPIGIAAAGGGVIYVSDALNHRIQRFTISH